MADNKPTYKELENQISLLETEIERLRSDEALQNENDIEFQLLFENSFDAILLTSSDENIYSANPVACEMFQMTEEEICSAGRDQLVDLTESGFQDAVQSIAKTGFFVGELRFIRKNASRFQGKLSSKVYVDKQGRKRICMIIRDISEQKTLEEKLKYTEVTLHTIFDIIPIGISLINNDGEIVQVNEFLEKNINLTQSELFAGKHKSRKYIHPDGTEMCPSEFASFRAINENQIIKDVETGILLDDNTVKWTKVSAAPIDIAGLSAVVVTKDIDIQKKKEQELQKAKEKLEESERALKTFFKKSNYIQLIIDPDTGSIIDANQAACDFYGYSFNEIIALNIQHINQNSDVSVKNALQRAKKGETNYFEFEHKLADGTIKQVEVYSNPIEIEGKNCLLSLVYDLSPRKRAERDLQFAKEKSEKSEEQFRLLFENMVQGFALHKMIYDEDGNPVDYEFIRINHSFEKLTGLKAENIVGKRVKEVLPGTEQLWIDNYGTVAKTQKVMEFESFSQDINRYYTVIAYSPQKDYFAVIFTDITKTKEQERLITEAKEKAEENEQYQINQTKEIELYNNRLESLLRISQIQTKSIQELLDYALDEAIELTNSKIGYIYFYDSNKQQFILNTWSKDVMKECRVMNPQTLYDLEKTGLWGEAVRQRKAIMVNDYSAPNPYKKGTPHGHVALHKFLTVPVIIDNDIVAVIGVANKEVDYNNSDVRQLTLLMDNVWKISERISLIENLQLAKDKAEEANRLKSEFLNNMSHEIRTPMNGIVGFAKMLDEPSISAEKRSFYSKIVQNSSHQLLKIIDEILEISTLGTKQVKIIETQFSLNDLLMELYSIFSIKSLDRNVPIHLKKGLHDIDAEITTDKIKLNKILSNLIENAVKFTSEGFIEIGYTVENYDLVIYVKDTGIGISQESNELIFERFSQAQDEVSTLYGGLGLGLSIAQENAHLLGGSIRVESEKYKGSVFYLTIPYKPVNAQQSENKQTGSSDIDTMSSYTILVAEDEEVNFLYIEALLELESSHSFNLIHAVNGQEAVDICLGRNDIDLVLMDIKMPVMTGYEATEKIKSQLPDLPIIAQTAYSTDADKELALKYGCDDFITKPIDENLLFSLINSYLIKK